VVVPPPGLVPGVPLPGVTLPTLPTVPAAAPARDSWWGSELVDWLHRAF
jgi:hypothetical protein